MRSNSFKHMPSRLATLLAALVLTIGSVHAWAQPVSVPFVERPFAHQEYTLYGYGDPNAYRYLPNVVTFDSRNRPYIRSRGPWADETGYVQTLRWDASGDEVWVNRSFTEAIAAFVTAHYGAGETFQYKADGGWYGGEIVFDRDDRLYTYVRIRLNDAGVYKNLLVCSRDYGRIFQVYELPDGEVDLEGSGGGHVPVRPPLIAIRQLYSTQPACAISTTYRYVLYVLQPKWSGDVLEGLDALVPVTDAAVNSTRHSGHASFAVSTETSTFFTYVAWVEPNDPNSGGDCAFPPAVTGCPIRAAEFVPASDPNASGGTVSHDVFVGYDNGPDINNMHNTPGIARDSAGYLHLISGAHNRSFLHWTSQAPDSVTAGWGVPETVLDTGFIPAGAPPEDEEGRQTYLSLAITSDDTLHVVSRQARKRVDGYFGSSYYDALVYQSRPAGGHWTDAEPQLIVVPPVPGYSIYYHKLSVDRRGRLFISYSYLSDPDDVGLYLDVDLWCSSDCPDGDSSTIDCDDYVPYCNDPNSYEAFYAYPAILMLDRSSGQWELMNAENLCLLRADLDGDGDVDLADLGMLLASYNSGAGGDLDEDGDTDLADLGILLAMYGQSCP